MGNLRNKETLVEKTLRRGIGGVRIGESSTAVDRGCIPEEACDSTCPSKTTLFTLYKGMSASSPGPDIEI